MVLPLLMTFIEATMDSFDHFIHFFGAFSFGGAELPCFLELVILYLCRSTNLLRPEITPQHAY